MSEYVCKECGVTGDFIDLRKPFDRGVDSCLQCGEEVTEIDEQEVESLIDEFEKIYLVNGWRRDKDKSNRVEAIKGRLAEILT